MTVPAAPGIVPGDGPVLLSEIEREGEQGPEHPFANKTGALSVPTTGGPKLVGAFLLILNNGGLAIGTRGNNRGHITTPVNLVGTEAWNSIILRAKPSEYVPGATYKWEIVSDETYVDRGNLRQGGDPEDTTIQSENDWVEFTAESLSTALADVKVTVTCFSPAGYPLWQDSITFTTADIRYLRMSPDPAYPSLGASQSGFIPMDDDQVSTSRPDSQENCFFRIVVGLSNEIATPLNIMEAQVCVRLAGIDEDGNRLDSDIYFNETPDLETVHVGLPVNPLSNVTYYTTVNLVGAIGASYYNSGEFPSVLLDTSPPPPSYSPRSYVAFRYGGTLRPYLVLKGAVTGGP